MSDRPTPPLTQTSELASREVQSNSPSGWSEKSRVIGQTPAFAQATRDQEQAQTRARHAPRRRRLRKAPGRVRTQTEDAKRSDSGPHHSPILFHCYAVPTGAGFRAGLEPAADLFQVQRAKEGTAKWMASLSMQLPFLADRPGRVRLGLRADRIQGDAVPTEARLRQRWQRRGVHPKCGKRSMDGQGRDHLARIQPRRPWAIWRDGPYDGLHSAFQRGALQLVRAGQGRARPNESRVGARRWKILHVSVEREDTGRRSTLVRRGVRPK